jgi:hypothetical protein
MRPAASACSFAARSACTASSARRQQFLFVLPAVGCVENRHQCKRLIAFDGLINRIDQYRQTVLVLPKHVERNFLDESLHAQQWANVRVVINSAGNGQQFGEPSTGKQPFSGMAGHCNKRLVHLEDGPVQTGRDVAAGSVFEQLRDTRAQRRGITRHHDLRCLRDTSSLP